MTMKNTGSTPPATSMTLVDAARIQATTAKANGGVVAKDSFAARAQRAAAKALSAYSTQSGHPFHGKPATQSTPNWATHSTPWRTVGA